MVMVLLLVVVVVSLVGAETQVPEQNHPSPRNANLFLNQAR